MKLLSNDSRYIKHPFALALHNEWLYFTDWSLKAVLKINKYNGGEISVISNAEKQPMGIAVVSNDTDNCWLNPCLNFNCKENYQKIITNDGKCGCICMKGYVYDKQLEKCSMLKLCSRTQFRCNNGLQCVSKESMCDTKLDCFDASDELNCTKKCEPSDKYFTCKNDSKKCLPIEYKCNKIRDCSDNSDEENCDNKCKNDQFQCYINGRCIDM